MNLPKPIRNLIESFEKLPGIGGKTAARLTFYLLHVPQEQLDEFAMALTNLKKDTVLCSICYNVADSNPCLICSDSKRDKETICVVEQPLDALAIEKGGYYNGVYHVLHGVISPLDNIGPDELYIKQLLDRLSESGSVTEVILAMNPNMEGEATAMYLVRKIRELAIGKFDNLKITRLGQGLPTGGDLEYADETTLKRAWEGRRDF